VAIDGTWQEAKEMAKALPGEMSEVALPVSFELGPAGASAPLRTEPAPGCTSTFEAVARALGALEGDVALRDALLAPLERLVDIQARYDPAVRQRLCGGSGAGIATSRRAGPGLGSGRARVKRERGTGAPPEARRRAADARRGEFQRHELG